MDDAHQQEAIRYWAEEAVPIVIAESETVYEQGYRQMRLFDSYLRQRYVRAGVIPASAAPEYQLQVFVTRDLAPASTFGDERLPCFGSARP